MASELAAFRRMERRLQGEAARADYLVDLSNVVRDRELGGRTPRSLERLRLVLAALRAWTGDAEATVHAIADDSLLDPRSAPEFPDPGELALLRDWWDRGLIASIAKADPDLLDHAKVLGTRVISRDYFRGHRGEHPWIQGDREHFLEPLRRADGSVRLVPRDMQVFADRVISQEGERDDLKARNLLDFRGRPRSEVLERSWRCPHTPCNPGPAIRAGKVVCRVHGTLLVDLGRRRPRLQLKIMVDGVCRAWENLIEDDGREYVLGRGHLARIEEGHLSDDRRGRISRHHLVIVSRRGTLRVLDASTARSRIRTLRSGRDPAPWQPLPHVEGGPAGAPRERLFRGFGPDDEIELVPGVVLRRSGQRWPGERADGVRAKPPGRVRGDEELTSTD